MMLNPIQIKCFSIFALINEKEMNYLNLEELARLFSHFPGSALVLALNDAQKKQSIELQLEGESLLELINRVNERETWKLKTLQQKPSSGSEHWMFGELKIFIAAALLRASITAKLLTDFGEDDEIYLHTIFPYKSLQFIKYQLARLIHSCSKSRREWTQEEQALLQSVISACRGKIEWRQVSVHLFEQSKGLFFRRKKECLEKWKNYLNPKVNKGCWTPEEDQILMKLIQRHGFRWSLIAKQFNGERTEHMVKNRYNSFIKKSKTQNKSKTLRVRKDLIQEDLAVPETQRAEKVEAQVCNFAETTELPLLGFSPSQSHTDPQEEGPQEPFSPFFEERPLQTSINCNIQLNPPSHEEELITSNYLSWQQPRPNAFQGIFSMQGQAQQSAISEVVAALGCTHYQRMFCWQSSWLD